MSTELTLDEALPWLKSQREAFEAALNGAPLETSLGVLIAALTGALGPDTRAAFYLFRDASLHHVVGMGADYAHAVDGLGAGPESLACGVARNSRQPVLTEDVTKDARWGPWLWLAETFAYRGCWSFPIDTATGAPVGALAVYTRLPRRARARDVEFASLMARTASIIIAHNVEMEARKQAEDAIRLSELRYRSLVNATSAVTWRCPPSGLQVEPQLEWMAFTGQSAEEMLGQGWNRAVHPDDASRVASRWSEAVRRGASFEGELRLHRHDGEWRWMSVRAAPIRDAGGAIVEWFGMDIDITEQKRAKEELERVNAELEQRVEMEVLAREQANAQLAQAEKLAALGELAGGVAHDFNNVLQAVVSSAEVLRKHPEDARIVTRVAQMQAEAAQRGVSITRRLLAFARRADLRSEPLDVGELLNGLMDLLGPAFGPGVRLGVEIDGAPPLVLADRGQLETALINLASNSRDAIGGEGEIRICARQAPTGQASGLVPGDYVRIDVIDDGSGMDAKTLARASEPFFTTKPVGKGTGLGLAMARGFAEQSGGALTIASAPGKGTTVSLWLPVAKPGAEGASEEAPDAPLKTTRILLVDDEPSIVDMLRTCLEDQGFEVATALGGHEALERLKSGAPFDLVVSDLSMPGVNGLDVIRAARASRPKQAAILLTGYVGDIKALELEGALGGGLSLLRKPVLGAELIACIRRLERQQVRA